MEKEINVCIKHDRFQTQNGRSLNITKDLKKHIKHTQSEDAKLVEVDCDICHDKEQVRMNFFGLMGKCSGEDK